MDASSLELAVQIAHESGHSSVFAAIVTDGMILKDQKVAIVSNFALEMFIKEKEELKWEKSIPWIDIKTVNYNNKRILLKFQNESYRLCSENNDALFGAIVHVLSQTMTQEEIKNIGLSKYKTPETLQTNSGALSRIIQLVDVRKGHTDRKSINQFKQALIFNVSNLDLNKFNNPRSIIPYVLDVLPLCKNFKSMVVPVIPKCDYYKMIVEHASHFSKLNYLQISGKSSHKFKSFTDAFENCDFVPCSLSFEDREFTENALKLLSHLISSKEITSIGLHKSFTQKSLNFFYSGFFTPTVKDTLVSLNLSGTKGINLSRLVAQLPPLLYLSLENCGFQVSEVLMCLSSPTMRDLRVIDISGSSCAHLPNDDAQLPQTLTQIIADNIRWGQESMQTFIKIIGKRIRNGLSLSFANASMNDNDWDLVFLELERSQFTSITSFRWNCNPVDTRLFNFLLRNTEMSSLDVSGCFTTSEIDTLEMFCEFVTMHIGLENLYVSGVDESYIGENIAILIHSVKQSKCIKLLDISNNRIGDKGLSSVKQFFNNASTLEVIDFDGAEPQTSNEIISVLEYAINSASSIKISFPVNDFNMMLRNKMIDHSTGEKIINLYKKKPTLNLNQKAKFPFPKNSPFFDPFIVFRYEKEPQFPLFITRTDAEKLKVTLPSPVVNRVQFNKKLSKVCRSNPNKVFSFTRNTVQYNISMMDDMSDSSSDEFDSRNFQVKFSINSLKPSMQQIQQNSPRKKNTSAKSPKKRERRNESGQEKPRDVEFIMPLNVIQTQKEQEMQQQSVQDSIVLNETFSLPAPPTPKSPKLKHENPPQDNVEDLLNKPTVPEVPLQSSVAPIPPEYASMIPHTSAYHSKVTQICNEGIEDYDYEEEDDYDYDDVANTGSKITNSAYKSGIIKFDGGYEYYSESEDDIDEEEDSDFFTTPPSSPHGKEHNYSSSDSYNNDLPKNEKIIQEIKLGSPPALPSFNEINKYEVIDDSSSSAATNNIENEKSQTKSRRTRIRTRTRTNDASVEEENSVRQKTNLFGSRAVPRNESSIYGSRIRNSQASFVPAPPLPLAQVQQLANESSIYGSRLNSKAANTKKESSIYGSRAGRVRQRLRPIESQTTATTAVESSSIYGSRVNRQRKPAPSFEMNASSNVRRRGAPPPAPVVRSVRSRTRTRTRDSRRQMNDYDTYSTYTSDGEDLQRPPPISSPKSTTIVSTSIGSPSSNNYRKY